MTPDQLARLAEIEVRHLALVDQDPEWISEEALDRQWLFVLVKTLADERDRLERNMAGLSQNAEMQAIVIRRMESDQMALQTRLSTIENKQDELQVQLIESLTNNLGALEECTDLRSRLSTIEAETLERAAQAFLRRAVHVALPHVREVVATIRALPLLTKETM